MERVWKGRVVWRLWSAWGEGGLCVVTEKTRLNYPVRKKEKDREKQELGDWNPKSVAGRGLKAMSS